MWPWIVIKVTPQISSLYSHCCLKDLSYKSISSPVEAAEGDTSCSTGGYRIRATDSLQKKNLPFTMVNKNSSSWQTPSY